jgi:putative aminopeptidase FrvX
MAHKLLKQLSEAFGGSGHEAEVATLVTGELIKSCDKVSTDAIGNVIALKKGKGSGRKKKKIMLAAHMDEIGFLVNHIDSKGFLRITPAGGFDPRTMIAQSVTVFGKGKSKLPGLLNVEGKPIHLQSPEERKKTLEVADFFVDLGLPARQVKKLVEIGDRVIWNRDLIEMGDCVTGKALDDRLGLYVMIEALRKVKNNKCDIYAVGTVQEEFSLLGAFTSSYSIEPDIAIALDVTLAVDIPGSGEHQQVTQLGCGTAIKIMDSLSISNPGLVKDFRRIADKKKIPYQLEILARGGTDAGGIQRARGGVRTMTLSIPLRYIHSVNETAHRKDIKATIDLLVAYLSG